MKDQKIKMLHGVWVLRSNRHWRELVTWHELPAKAQADFDDVTGEDRYSPRFVKYRGDWLDACDVMIAPEELKAAGWYGFNADSYSTGIAYRWSKDCERVMLASCYVKSDI